MKTWGEQSPAERSEWENRQEQELGEARRKAARAERKAAYDTLLSLHEYLLPEYYNREPPKGSKTALLAALHHVIQVVDAAVYYHPEARRPEE